MLSAHHGNNEKRLTPQFEAMLKRFEDQVNGSVKRAYSDGRITPTDDGDLTFAIAADEKHGQVVIDFGKPVTWIAMTPAQVAEFVKLLIKNARLVAKEPFTVEI